MEPMAMRVAEMGASECCPVIGQTEVASPQGDNITSPETELTSRWSSNSRASLEYFFLQYAAFLHLVQEKILEPHRASVKSVLKSCAYCFRPCRVIWPLTCPLCLAWLGFDHVL